MDRALDALPAFPRRSGGLIGRALVVIAVLILNPKNGMPIILGGEK